MDKQAKNTICLWYDGGAEDAARFYASTFPDSSVGAVHLAPGDFPSGKKGDVLTVEFTVMGIPCLGLNGGPAFKQSEAFSFQVATVDQAETDRNWNAIVGNGGEESACGWSKDKWGVSWQITPVALTDGMNSSDPATAKRVFDAMMKMKKIDVAAIERARKGELVPCFFTRCAASAPKNAATTLRISHNVPSVRWPPSARPITTTPTITATPLAHPPAWAIGVTARTAKPARIAHVYSGKRRSALSL